MTAKSLMKATVLAVLLASTARARADTAHAFGVFDVGWTPIVPEEHGVKFGLGAAIEAGVTLFDHVQVGGRFRLFPAGCIGSACEWSWFNVDTLTGSTGLVLRYRHDFAAPIALAFGANVSAALHSECFGSDVCGGLALGLGLDLRAIFRVSERVGIHLVFEPQLLLASGPFHGGTRLWVPSLFGGVEW